MSRNRRLAKAAKEKAKKKRRAQYGGMKKQARKGAWKKMRTAVMRGEDGRFIKK